ncbi:MAG: adenylyltransferase/cytidyltransferase family protein, partial [Puniceicoccales bacterium]|nr:adenylyltransferase/cytidyltransferase family protein [Puniceicoccales bacterium]
MDKLLSPKDLSTRRQKWAGRRLVLTNGCFDLLHGGHVRLLQTARSYGDGLWVGLNGDRSVRQLKGPSRPLREEKERAYILSALACVDGVFIFDGPTLAKEILLVKPEVYVKSSDYTLETLHPEEREALQRGGTEIRFVSLLEGISTTGLVT